MLGPNRRRSAFGSALLSCKKPDPGFGNIVVFVPVAILHLIGVYRLTINVEYWHRGCPFPGHWEFLSWRTRKDGML
jgi:hypothetical protein